jgi:hypothetical protein
MRKNFSRKVAKTQREAHLQTFSRRAAENSLEPAAQGNATNRNAENHATLKPSTDLEQEITEESENRKQRTADCTDSTDEDEHDVVAATASRGRESRRNSESTFSR